MMQIYRYINQYKFGALVLGIVLISIQTPVIGQKFEFGIIAGYEFSSAYFDSFDEFNTSEQIKTNYSLGLIVGKVYDTALMNYKFGIYSLYRSFSVKFHENNMDPNFTDYLTEIRPEYLILGIPLSIDWKLYSQKKIFVRARTGLSFELSLHRTEYSYYNNGKIWETTKLIDSPYGGLGIPFSFGIGAEADFKKIRLGIYPTVKYYLKNIERKTKSDISRIAGVNLILFFKSS